MKGCTDNGIAPLPSSRYAHSPTGKRGMSPLRALKMEPVPCDSLSGGWSAFIGRGSNSLSGPMYRTPIAPHTAGLRPGSTPEASAYAYAYAGVKALLALLFASLSACAVPSQPEPRGPVAPCRCAPLAPPVKLAPVPFRTLDRATERAIEPPGLEPLIVTTET